MPISLVTGGAGFIGSHVADELLKMGHKVIILDDMSGGFEENVPHHAVLCKGSILDVDLIDRLFRTYHFDYVYHLAAYAAEGLSHFIKQFNYLNNLMGSVNLINAAVNYKVKCFVFTSSMAVYGEGSCPLLEISPMEPEDSYGIAKLAVEKELKVTHKMFGMDYIVFRPHNVYGERQNIGDRYRNVVGIFMNQLMQGEPMTIFGDGEQMRAFSHISNVAPVIADSINHPSARNQVFNIGADVPTIVNDLAIQVADAMGYFPNIVHLDAREEVKIAYCDHTKLRHHFSLKENVPLSKGLKQMATWAKEHGARQSKPFSKIEISKNLPSFWLRENSHV